jgi:hypothetical protein
MKHQTDEHTHHDPDGGVHGRFRAIEMLRNDIFPPAARKDPHRRRGDAGAPPTEGRGRNQSHEEP